MKFYGQYGQDRFLDQQVFKGQKHGVFVDIGANDGITYSNTYFFEKNRGWSGLCIEPHPDAFVKLKLSRTCKIINAGISREEGELEFVQINGYAEMLSGLKYKYETKHLSRIQDELSAYGGSQKTILVNCKRLDSILIENKIDQVDYCSLDIEGGELEALETIDLNKKQVKIFTVENNYYGKTLKKYFRNFNYKLIATLNCDEVYERRRSLFHFFV